MMAQPIHSLLGEFMADVTDFLNTQTPTVIRPLLGLTILLVEDSLTACEAMRLMCLRSGARIRRADCLESARRHLRVYRPNIVLVDMGLPDGSGGDLISELSAATPRVEAVIALSADPARQPEAVDAGADGFIEKPLGSLAEFQAAIMQYLAEDQRPLGPRRVSDDPVPADPIAVQEDLALAQHLLRDGDQNAETKTYLATFLAGVASTARDDELRNIAETFAQARAMTGPERQKLDDLLSQRLQTKAVV